MTGWHRPDVETSTLEHLAQIVGPTSARQMVDGLLAKGRAQGAAEARTQIAQEVNRARKPEFAAGEDPALVVKTTRAIDIRLIEMGDQAPYWVPAVGVRS